MMALILVIIVTIFSIFVSCEINVGEVTWLDYYHGGVVGFLVSGIILQISNKWRRMNEIEKNPPSFMNIIRNWN